MTIENMRVMMMFDNYLYIQDDVVDWKQKLHYQYCPICGEKVEGDFDVIQNDWKYNCPCGCNWLEEKKS